MGGFGSGRRAGYGKKDAVEDCRNLDVRDWHKKGYLDGGPVSLMITWRQGKGNEARIGATASRERIRLSYVYWGYGDESNKKSVDYTVHIARTACNFGGERPWFVCPGIINGRVCRRRVAKLYLKFGYFLCRHCHDLSYETQQVGRRDAALRRCQQIRQRLGGSANMTIPFPPRPKGMHSRTYWKLWDEHDRAEQEYTGFLIRDMDSMNSFLSRIGRKDSL